MNTPSGNEINFVRCLKCRKILKCSRYDTAALLDHIRTDHTEIDIIDTEKAQYPKESAVTDPLTTDKIKMGYSCFRSSENSYGNNSKKQETEDREKEIGEADFENKATQEREPQHARDIDLTHYSITSELLEKYPEIKDCEYCPRNPNASVVYTRRYKVNTPTATSASTIAAPQKCKLYRTSIEKWRPANGTIYCPKCGCSKRPLIKSRAERFTSNECGACCLLSCWPFCFIPCLIPGQNLEYLHCSNCKNFLGLYDRDKNCIRPNRLFANENQQTEEDVDIGKENDTTDKVSNNPENDSFKPKSSASILKSSPRLPSIVIDGKELHPDMVARLQKFKKYSSLAGIDLDAVIDKETPNSSNRDISFKENVNASDKAPSVENASKPHDKSYT